ncbi:hypothetical protein DOE63_16420 [Salmonella enterica subsp. diarizonae serovar 59:z10:-]|nr:hypothetical protein DOE63_16420 [Salmonella enterica subsp. diarizonae serovar 59:z10:-]
MIFTNTTQFTTKQIMNLYSRRMQIKQNFRDEKIPRRGFGLREGMSLSTERPEIPGMTGILASIIM